MERSLLIAAAGGVCLALCLLIAKQSSTPAVAVETVSQPLVQDKAETESTDSANEKESNPTDGWITVHEPKADWNVSDSDLIHFICPRPEWYPYHTFRGPPIPESSAELDPAGFVLRTAQGVRLHRDGWIVTTDGRAYQADPASDQS